MATNSLIYKYPKLVDLIKNLTYADIKGESYVFMDITEEEKLSYAQNIGAVRKLHRENSKKCLALIQKLWDEKKLIY